MLNLKNILDQWSENKTTTAKMNTISTMKILMEVYAGFLQNMSRSRELFEIIQNENARKRHRVHIAYNWYKYMKTFQKNNIIIWLSRSKDPTFYPNRL